MSPPPRFFYRFSTSSSFPGPDYESFRRWHGHRRPSRLLWFAIGATSATVYIMHKQAHQNEKAMYWNNCYRAPVHQQPQNNGDLSQVMGDSLPTVPGNGYPTPSPYPYSHPHHHSHWSWGFARERSFQYPPVSPPGVMSGNENATPSGQVPLVSVPPTQSIESQSPQVPAPAPTVAPVQTQTVPWGFESKSEQQKTEWEDERQRLLAKAQDTMSELSESTLDSLSSTVEALKAKLTEHRLKREQQQKIIDKELEDQKKKPVRYV
ncbi:hypothetical protein BDP27DRAFT_1320694 [Rhodocollybia butyracea]|uniref:Uncharacterized protein n=1 Tax=Rhodocollybia butyracea TaxID=206335 RepID=A0A9P5Q1C1_9AGAR|nr:hypothetical protein BDP27DRAFT_1320694 [Rhodocollybia butyracea]